MPARQTTIHRGTPDQAPPRTFYTVAEVAASTRLSRKKVYALCKDGLLRHIRVGQSIRIPGDALKELEALADAA